METEMKVCTKCGIEKPITDFNWRDKAKGTRRSECKICHTQYMKNKYQKKREFVGEIKQKLACAKCGYNEYAVALDFHHIDPAQKDTTIARLISNRSTLDKVKEEIDKCICLCSNCHRVFHFREKEEGITIEQFLSG